MHHHFLVLMKLIHTRLLKSISKKISKSNLYRMNSGNIFLTLLLKIPFRKLWGRVFLLMLSHCQILREVLEFKFDATVKRIYEMSLREILGTKYLFVTKEEDLSAIYFHLHTFARLFFFLYSRFWKQSRAVDWGAAISVIAKYFWFFFFSPSIWWDYSFWLSSACNVYYCSIPR